MPANEWARFASCNRRKWHSSSSNNNNKNSNNNNNNNNKNKNNDDNSNDKVRPDSLAGHYSGFALLSLFLAALI